MKNLIFKIETAKLITTLVFVLAMTMKMNAQFTPATFGEGSFTTFDSLIENTGNDIIEWNGDVFEVNVNDQLPSTTLFYGPEQGGLSSVFNGSKLAFIRFQSGWTLAAATVDSYVSTPESETV